MEVKRLYDRERRLITGLIIGAAFIILAGVLTVAPIGRKTFKDYLLDKNYEKLYTFIKEPDFSFNIFSTYMDYNYGGNINIINTEKSDNTIIYKVQTDVGEKFIMLQKKEGEIIWNFDDYIYDWKITIPKYASLFIENMEFENNEGEVLIGRLPFAVYQMRVTAKNCIDYDAKVMAGQKLSIKLDITASAMKNSKEVVNEYISFKSDAINRGLINNISCVDKDSGIYKEVVDQVEWLKNIDYKMIKELQDFRIENGWIDFDGIICLAVIESWNTTIISENGESKTYDEYRNMYFIDPEDNFKIVKIKTEQL